MLNLNNPSITDSISKLDPKAISNASPRHIQSVLEDLIVVCLEGQILADKVLRLNPKSEEIGTEYLSLAINHPGIFAIDIDGEVVGSIGLFPQTDIHQKSAELGYWLAEPFWGNGIVPQAIGEIVEYGFKTFDIVRIYARPFSTNRASQRVLEKAGFTCEARHKKALYKNGEFMDELVYVTFKDEY